MSGLTIELPMSRAPDEEGGFQLLKTYRALVKQNFRNLLLTIPGERVMLPNFGIGAARYLFEQGRGINKIRERIYEQADEYMPYIEIVDINIDVVDHIAAVEIRYKITPLQQFDELNVSVYNE